MSIPSIPSIPNFGGLYNSLVSTASRIPLINSLLFHGDRLSNDKFFSKIGDSTRDPQPRRSLNFNGTTQYVRVLDNTDLDITDNLSVVCWVKNDGGISTQEWIFGKYEPTGNQREWLIGLDTDSTVRIQLTSDGSTVAIWKSTNPITITNVNTIGFTYVGGSALTVYVNGVAVSGSFTSGSLPASLFNGTGNLTIGSAGSGANPFDGDVYEARIYDTTVLTAGEMLAIHQNPTGHAPVGATLKAHYKIDQGAGITVFDSSGNGNHGTAINSPTWGTSTNAHSWHNQVGYSEYIYFDGVNDCVDTGYNDLDATQAFEIEFTAQIDKTTGAQVVFSNDSLTGPLITVFSPGIAPQQIALFIRQTPGTDSLDVISNDGSWDVRDGMPHVIRLTYDGSKDASGIKIYLDGVEASAYTVNSNTLTSDVNSISNFYIGSSPANTAPMEGIISDVTISKSATPVISYNGYGNTNADWTDQIGTNHGTVNGSPASIFIPRDESDITKDIFGEDLQYSGVVSFNALLKGSNTITLNNSTQYGEFPSSSDYQITIEDFSFEAYIKLNALPSFGHIIDCRQSSTEGFRMAVTSTGAIYFDMNTAASIAGGTMSTGTSYKIKGERVGNNLNVYIDDVLVDTTDVTGLSLNMSASAFSPILNGRSFISPNVNKFDGEISGVKLTIDGTTIFHNPIAEGVGTKSYDVSGNDNHITWVNTPSWTTQDAYHYNIQNGFNKYAFNGFNNKVTLRTVITLNEGDILEFDAISLNAFGGHIISRATGPQGRIWLTSDGIAIQDASSNIATASGWDTSEPHSYRLVGIAGSEWEVYVDGVLRGTTSGLTTNIPNLAIIAGKEFTSAVELFFGNITNFKYYDGGVLTHSYNGGGTTADWVDQTGSNDGIYSGANIRIPAETATTDVFGETLRNVAVVGHNDAETDIDFGDIAVGGTTPPEMAHINGNANFDDFDFNDDTGWDSVDYAFYRQKDAYANDRFLIYKSALTGNDLTRAKKYTNNL